MKIDTESVRAVEGATLRISLMVLLSSPFPI